MSYLKTYPTNAMMQNPGEGALSILYSSCNLFLFLVFLNLEIAYRKNELQRNTTSIKMYP